MKSVAISQEEAQKIRREHLEDEANLRSLEYIYYVLAAILVVSGFALIIAIHFDAGGIVLAVFMWLIAGFFVWLGREFKRLSYPAAIIACVVAISALCLFPLGTAIGVLTLWSILSKKGRFVVTPQYHRIIAATPDIECRPGGVLLASFAMIGLLIGLILFVVVVAHFRGQ